MLDQYKGLVKSQAWGQVVEIAEAQIRTRELDDWSLLSSFDEALERNGRIGERLGIQLVLRIPQQMIDELEFILGIERENDDAGD